MEGYTSPGSKRSGSYERNMSSTSHESGLARDIFLTGATGVVGGRILMEILRYTTSACHCLVRAGTPGEADERISRILRMYGMEEDEYRRHRSRVIPVPGDLTRDRFGLDSEAYDGLVQKASLVIHMAADINMVASYAKLRGTNIDGTDRIVEFCLQSGCPVVYGSTYGIIGNRIYERGYVFGEDELDMGQKFSESHYPRTKLEAEQQIRKAGSRGLRWIILRLGDVMGDSRSGAYPLDGKGMGGIYYDMLKTILETGIAPFSEDRFYITPVDYAARATLYLALNQDAYRSTFHILNADQHCFYYIVNLLVECGYAVRMFPVGEYAQLFGKNRVWREGNVYRSIFTRMMAGLPPLPGRVECARVSVSRAERLLSPASIHCAPLDYNLMATYLNFCIRSGYLPSPADQRPLAEIR
jgi:thioester reductase-like protein